MDLQEKYKEIQDVYLTYNTPFIVGFSGGKDSTASLQLVWNALSEIKDKLNKPVYIVFSDTNIETPLVVDYLYKTLDKIRETAKKDNLPFYVEIIYPNLNESFWVNIIGKGYPAPSRKFRWCSDRLKVNPMNRFIKDKISKYGEVILILGVRTSESTNRKRSIEKRTTEDSLFLSHDHLKKAKVYPVIKDWSVQDVWGYLLNNPSPFGTDNRELFNLYKQANTNVEDCLGSNDASCGNSRFGCWSCTVVEKEKSLNALIENGEEWLRPLSEFRQFLFDSSKKPELRRDKVRKGKPVKGGFLLDFRKVLLEKLLETEKQVGFKILRDEELEEIKRIWSLEEAT